MARAIPLPPGPRTPSVVQLLQYAPRPAEFLDSCARKFGPCFTVKLAGFGKFVMLARPAAIRDVFRGDPRALHSGEANRFLEATVGPRSVLVLDEEEHAAQRGILVPPLHGERMRSHVARMRRATEDEITRWQASAGREFPLEASMRAITLRCILEVALGLEGDEGAALGREVARMLAYGRLPYAIALARISPHRLLSSLPFLPYYRELRNADRLLREHIRRRRAGLESSTARGDVLDDLLRARLGDGVAGRDPDDEIRDALMTVLAAGHDTTSVALSWVFKMVLERPDVVAAIREEVARVTGGEPIGAEHLPRLELVDASIREALRLSSIVPFVTRLTKRPFVADGVEFPAGVHLCPCIHLVHRDPELYPEPETFRPQRFLERKFAAWEWLPFGGAERLCTGMAFAMTQMKVVLATVISRTELVRPVGATTRRVRRGVLVAPSDGTRVMMHGLGRNGPVPSVHPADRR
jgi:cytochrome P450